MDEPEYLKCPCKECGNNIEFPLKSLRDTVPCPHCGEWTELLVAEAEKDSGVTLNLNFNLSVIAIGLCVILAAGLGIWLYRFNTRISKQPSPDSAPAIVAPPTPRVIPTNTPVVIAPAAAQVAIKPRAKSSEDLKVGDIQLEKTPGNSLVYAVGTMKNDSDWQHFGVRIQLDLLNAQGRKIGTTQDYKDILEPHQDWKFRALIPDTKTAAVKMEKVKEQE